MTPSQAAQEKLTSPRTSAGRALHKAEMFDLGNEEDRRRLALAIEAEAAAATPSLDAQTLDLLDACAALHVYSRFDLEALVARLDEGSATPNGER